ncbi:MAG: translation initiation factor IF-2 [Candidatus Sericytochromatia bacterium]|nr:translation initiation factor IF-2 [Candidatus Sericytochromatia bacterium]
MGKVQICKMAKDLNIPGKDLVQAFNDLGVEVKNHLAWVEDHEAEAVRKKLLEPKLEPAPAPVPATAAPAAAQPQVAVPARPDGRPGMAPPTPSRPIAPGMPVRPGSSLPGGPSPVALPPRPAGFNPNLRFEIRPDQRPDRFERAPGARPPGAPGAAAPGAAVPGRPAPGAPARKGEGRSDHERRRKDEEDIPAAFNKPKPGRKKSKAEMKMEREERRRARQGGGLGEAPTTIDLVGSLTVKELADRMAVKETEIIKRLFVKGILATINQTIEKETAEMIAVEMGYEVNLIDPIAQALAAVTEDHDAPEDLKSRAPIVTVMGHVDHGKTSLLDAIRETRVASGEAGGITQHIGAYMTSIHGNEICFLDTPGHEAFTAMRARGAKATDIAILVVAADDGVMPQTIEAISHAKAANVPIIVAINKVDKPDANPDRVKQELTEYELVPEEWGGQTVMVEVSAKKRLNIDHLLEMILLVAEVQELKANPDKPARGMIVEAKLSKSMGPVATVLVQNGTLRVGDAFVVGSVYGKVRALIDDRGRRVKEAGPAHPVEVLGSSDVPHAGDVFQVMPSEKEAKAVADQRALQARSEALTARSRVHLKDFYTRIQEGQKELAVIIKADVKGSNEAIEQALSQLNQRTEGTTIRILFSGNGDISETDVSLAAASDALIIGFNVKADDRAVRAAEEADVDIKLYSIIYKMIEDLENAMLGLLEPEYETVKVGQAEVRAIFKAGKQTIIAGCMVTEGKIVRQAEVKVLRAGKLIHEGKLESLKRFKDDVKEVATGYECGIAVEKYTDLVENDIIEAYITQEKAR